MINFEINFDAINAALNIDPTHSYLYLIMALLPLSATMVVLQTNPYHALVIRGILGAMAALIYALFGAADVALTEALVGTLLAITLSAVAVRSSMVMRLGVLEGAPHKQGLGELRSALNKHYMRLELVPYPDDQSLHQALIDQDLHAACTDRPIDSPAPLGSQLPYHLTIRVPRLYDILQAELAASTIRLSYLDLPASGQPASDQPISNQSVSDKPV